MGGHQTQDKRLLNDAPVFHYLKTEKYSCLIKNESCSMIR